MSETDSTSTDSTATDRTIAHRQSRKSTEAVFAPCFKVSVPGAEAILVPIDKLSSDNKRLLLVAKARMLVEHQLDRLYNATLTPAEIKDIVKAVAEMDALQREQYITAVNNNVSTAKGKELGNIIKSAAEGATSGALDFLQKAKKMDDAAKKMKKAEPVDV